MGSTRTSKTSYRESSIKRANRTSVNGFLDNFHQNICAQNSTLPKIAVDSGQVNKLGIVDENLPTVTISFRNDTSIIQGVNCKGNEMSDELLNALSDTIGTFNTLTEIKLEFCNLNEEHISTIAISLQNNKNITHLSLTGNPTLEQNYHEVLVDSNLRILSLQHCQLNSESGERIAKAITEPLEYLNLASNFLSDAGVVFIADALRGNRYLRALNLADNLITPIGLVYFFHCFCKFPLKHEEIVFRRHCIMDFLRNTMEFQRTYISNKKRRSLENTSRKSSSVSNASKSNESVTLPMQSSHPFVMNSEPESLEIYCSGNNTLLHLNISYNSIDETVLKTIINALRYQKAMFFSENRKLSGLARLVMEGKAVEQYPALIDELYNVLYNVGCSKKSSKSSSRRSSSAHMVTN